VVFGQGDAVHAEALTGRGRAIVEDMAEVAAAGLAVYFRAHHELAPVGRRLNRIVHRREETRPTGAAVELGV
jgi:hypothetical protein